MFKVEITTFHNFPPHLQKKKKGKIEEFIIHSMKQALSLYQNYLKISQEKYYSKYFFMNMGIQIYNNMAVN